MKCPNCGKNRIPKTSQYVSSVIDSRTSTDGTTVRRRRRCDCCRKNWTTAEVSVEVTRTGRGALGLALVEAAASPDRLEGLWAKMRKVSAAVGELEAEITGAPQ